MTATSGGPELSSVDDTNVKKEVMAVIYGSFESVKNKELSFMRDVRDQSIYTRFGDLLPHSRQDWEDACTHDEAKFATIADYSYTIEDEQVQIFENTALATFYLNYSGMAVSGYTFEGRQIKRRCRASVLLRKKQGRWFIVHEHYSELEDI
ncbi:MAG: nuclear transport factor 2 family protein [Nitrososphaerales archaeon]